MQRAIVREVQPKEIDMSKRIKSLIVAALVAVGAVAVLNRAEAQPGGNVPVQAKVRIGVYDSRCIAVAFASSKHLAALVDPKWAERDAARKAGDTKRVAELEQWGNDHQVMMHCQGFSRAPVTDLLKPVDSGVQKLLAEKGLSAIVFECNATAPGVEVVDVTDDLVTLYEPNAKTLAIVRDIKSKDPLPLPMILQMKD